MSAVQKIDPNTALTVVDDAQQKRDMIRATYGRGLSDPEFDLMLADAAHKGLDVVTRDVAAIKFGTGPAVIMTTVGGLRKLADRSGLLDGTEGPLFCGADGKWTDVWLDEKAPPKAAKFTVWRKDRNIPITAVVTWAERAQRTGQGTLMPTWKAMPAHMLGKVAESDAYKKARLVPDYRDEVDDPTDRKKAYGRLHAAAEAQGLSHEQARRVVAQIAPGTQSLTDEDVSVEDLHDAASLIQELGEDAIIDVDEDGVIVVDDEPSEREQWRIHVREVYQAQDREAAKALRDEAGQIGWRWEEMIAACTTLGAAKHQRDYAVKAGMRREDADAWLQEWEDRAAIASDRSRQRVVDAQPQMFDAGDPDRFTR